MTLLNLKTFLNVTAKNNSLYYYSHKDFNIFTDGVVVYGSLKKSNSDETVKNFEELYNNRTIEFPLSKSLDDVVRAYKTGFRNYVTNYIETSIERLKVVEIYSQTWKNKGYLAIDKKYKKCCKANPKKGKYCYIIDTKIKDNPISVYFESNQKTGEFIMIMPIELRK